MGQAIVHGPGEFDGELTMLVGDETITAVSGSCVVVPPDDPVAVAEVSAQDDIENA
jgi:hypothetical protein